ncbi:MAG: hypothetical protein ACREPQ_03965 [Rhodanobacter sp.]
MDNLERALELSAQMLLAAQAGDWANVTTLQAQCDALLRCNHAGNDVTRTALLELQRQYRNVTGLAGQAREAIALELGRHRHSHRALSAYLVSSDGQ